jgi:hypothetical protein
MSVYAINKLLYLTENDESFRQRIKSDPEKVLAETSLTSEEREALTSGDVLKLFEMGVHAFLLNNMGRHELFGVNSQNYFPRVRGEETP